MESLVSRLTYAHFDEEDLSIHFGVAAEYRKVDDEHQVRFRERPEQTPYYRR